MILGIWWFIFQQKRPGPKIPKGSNYASIGFKQIWLAIREIRSLPQTFLYFFAYFLLADGLNTTGTSHLTPYLTKFANGPQAPSSVSSRMTTFLFHFYKSHISASLKPSVQLHQPLAFGTSNVTSSSRQRPCSCSPISSVSSFHFGV